jgi:hypothetical protein
MTARSETMSRRHPGVLFVPTGNQASAIVTEALTGRVGKPRTGLLEPKSVDEAPDSHERSAEIWQPRRVVELIGVKCG